MPPLHAGRWMERVRHCPHDVRQSVAAAPAPAGRERRQGRAGLRRGRHEVAGHHRRRRQVHLMKLSRLTRHRCAAPARADGMHAGPPRSCSAAPAAIDALAAAVIRANQSPHDVRQNACASRQRAGAGAGQRWGCWPAPWTPLDCRASSRGCYNQVRTPRKRRAASGAWRMPPLQGCARCALRRRGAGAGAEPPDRARSMDGTCSSLSA